MHWLVCCRRVQELPNRVPRKTSLREEQLEARLADSLASYLIRITLKTLISSSASLLAYFHEVFTTSVFLYSKGLSFPYRSDFFFLQVTLFLCFCKEKRKKKQYWNVHAVSCSRWLLSVWAVHTERWRTGPISRGGFLSLGTSLCAR